MEQGALVSPTREADRSAILTGPPARFIDQVEMNICGSRPVFVQRLIAENTVEVAMQEMQARKQALADALFEGTGEGALTLTEADIDLLFGRRGADT